MSVFDMTGIPDDGSLEDQLKWRRFADRVDRLFKPSGRKRAELAKALAAYAKAARDARRLACELWASETEWFEGCKRRAADEQDIDLEYDPEPDTDPELDMFWERLEEFADCEETLLESAQTADTIIRLVAGGNAGSDGRGTVDGRP
ncbi:hypothetical protein SCX11_10355 [Bifidobacterium longum]|uniref:Uncharacterized protein n=1 Tax=Bifidobacterium longum TaxID=216816 RepID=A0AAW9CR99_BIFLN|nr:hypothetical protein [Bifidobacterium longum]MDW7547091.1 hypothetical protein [Bifidobacterium longum]MDW7582680.1 hypothetical protein [Bifidobacterium longum]